MTATMTATTTATASTATISAGSLLDRRSGQARTANPRWALAAVVAGLVLITASATTALVAVSASGRTASHRPVTPVSAGAQDSTAAFPSVGTSAVTYEPGHTSGWHVHPGVHSVVVLSGTLTIYDEHCVRTDYGPGDTYLGGNAPHLARNNGVDQVDVAITYVYQARSPDHGTPVAAPEGCDVR